MERNASGLCADYLPVMAYDQATGAPLGISSGIGQSSSVQQLTYTWGGYGNLTEREDDNQSLTETFGYDDLNRLTGSTVTNPAANGPASQYYYDAAGDITSKTIAGVTSTYTYDPNHPYAVDSVTNVNGGTYTASYDPDGNMVTRDGYSIQWTPSNLPSSISGTLGSSTFNYGPDGNRYYQAETFNGVTTDTTYIAGGLFEVVTTSSGTTEYRHHILADGQVIAVHTIDQNGSAGTSYLHYDQLGSVDAITNDQGSVIQSMSFDAFGNRRLTTSWDYGVSQNTLATLNNYTNRGYTDQEELDNLSLVDMNGRVYDPTVGRFISADPTVAYPGYSQAFNRYSYVYNSPLGYVDPSGFTPICQGDNAPDDDCKEDGGGNSWTDTGSHIQDVETGAGCFGDCAGWGPMGEGTGSGSSSSPADESGGAGGGGGGGGSCKAGTICLGTVNVTCIASNINQCTNEAAAVIPLEIEAYFHNPAINFSDWVTPTVESCQRNNAQNACEMAALAFAESGTGCPADSCEGVLGVEEVITNRAGIGRPAFPGSIHGVIFETKGGFNASEDSSQAFENAEHPLAGLSGANLASYQVALDAAPLVMAGLIPDETFGATYFYSGLTAPPKSTYAGNPAKFLRTFVSIPAWGTQFNTTFYGPIRIIPMLPPLVASPGGG